MKRNVLIALTVVLLLVMAVPAFAAITGLNDQQKKEVTDLQNQIVDTRKQIVDKYVESGQITAEEGKAIKDRMDQAAEYRQENNILPGAGGGLGCGGGGCGGGGCGMNGGFAGKGFGRGAWGGFNNQNVQ